MIGIGGLCFGLSDERGSGVSFVALEEMKGLRLVLPALGFEGNWGGGSREGEGIWASTGRWDGG